LIPLFLDLKGKKAVVYGGGPVGQRKALFLAKEMEVTIVDRSWVQAPSGCRCLMGEALDNLDLIDTADLVVAATGDPLVNEAICVQAKARAKWYNCAEGPGTFLIPSVVQKRNFTVAVSTMGRSPGMSKFLREHLDVMLTGRLEDMVDLTEDLRADLKDRVPDTAERESILRRLIHDPELWDAIQEDPVKARAIALRKVVG